MQWELKNSLVSILWTSWTTSSLGICPQEARYGRCCAYGWPADMSDDEILRRLLVFNLERAGQRDVDKESVHS
jgi:hypothetical protein